MLPTSLPPPKGSTLFPLNGDISIVPGVSVTQAARFAPMQSSVQLTDTSVPRSSLISNSWIGGLQERLGLHDLSERLDGLWRVAHPCGA